MGRLGGKSMEDASGRSLSTYAVVNFPGNDGSVR